MTDYCYKRTRRKPLAEINVVPYIDVTLVLLVIFMVTTPLLTAELEVDLPDISTKVSAQQKKLPIIVSINTDGRFYLDSKNPQNDLSGAEVINHIQAKLKQDPGEQVALRADKGVAYDKVIGLINLLKEAKINRVGLVTEITHKNNKTP